MKNQNFPKSKKKLRGKEIINYEIFDSDEQSL